MEASAPFPGLVIDSIPATTTPFDARKLLMDLVKGRDELASSTNIQSLISDRLIANLELITPSILADGLTINTISPIDKELNLNGDVIFFGRPYFATDTAGFAIVRQGERKVDITFEREYLEQPVVNANISLEDNDPNGELILSNNINYIITSKTAKGFSILLNKAAPADIKFSWIALAVKNPRIFNSTPQPAAPSPAGNSAPVPIESTPPAPVTEPMPETPTVNEPTVVPEAPPVIETPTPEAPAPQP